MHNRPSAAAGHYNLRPCTYILPILYQCVWSPPSHSALPLEWLQPSGITLPPSAAPKVGHGSSGCLGFRQTTGLPYGSIEVLVGLLRGMQSLPVFVFMAADLCPTSISRRRSLLVVPTTVKKCCPDLGTGQTCKFATGSSVGVCCTTGEDL